MQNKNIQLPEVLKNVLDKSTTEEIAETEINLVNAEYQINDLNPNKE